MKQKRVLRIFSFVMAILMLSSSALLAACGPRTSDEIPSEESTTSAADPLGTPDVSDRMDFEALKYPETNSKPKVRAAFVGKKSMPLIPMRFGDAGGPSVTLSASWTSDTVYLYVAMDAADRLILQIGNYSTEYIRSDASTVKFSVTSEQMGIAIVDVGQQIPLLLQIDYGEQKKVFDGSILLNDYEVLYYADGENYGSYFERAKVSAEGESLYASHFGAKSLDGCISVFDRYSASGENYAKLRNVARTKAVTNLGLGNADSIVEFDLNIESMPIIPWEYWDESNAYGFSVAIAPKEDGQAYMIGFVNTTDGIYAYINGQTEDSSAMIATGKRLGETFHVGLLCEDGRLSLLIDNVLMVTAEEALLARSDTFSARTVSFIWQRGDEKALSAADDFVANVDNLSIGNITVYTMLGTISANQLVGGEAKVMAGTEIFLAEKNLILPSSVSSKKYGLTSSVYWHSEKESVISSAGELKYPESTSEIIKIHAYLIQGDTIVSEQSFPFFVKAVNPSSNVLMVKYDVDPITGQGKTADTTYIADGVHNSIVYDMGTASPINRAVLNSLNESNRLSKNFVALYWSNDNATYTAIPEFTMLQAGNEVYFYNFSVTARYLKIHFTYESDPTEEFAIFNFLQNQMNAYYSEEPLLKGDGEFAKHTAVEISNDTASVVYNRVEQFTLDSLGISAADLKKDLSDIRFCYDGKQLPHYVMNGILYVRIFELAANEKIQVDVYYGNETASSVANGPETFEVEYGNKVTTAVQPGVSWITTVEQMPDGSLIIIGSYSGQEELGIIRSTDGGRTWSKMEKIQFTADSNYTPEENMVDDSGGFIVDREKGIAYFLCVHNIPYGLDPDVDASRRSLQMLITKDSGKTWSIRTLTEISTDFRFGTYSDGLKVSCYDGAGANVDYVFTLSMKRDGVRYLSSIYSTDDGNTWKLSESRISVDASNTSFEAERGLSEETVWEQEDGTLVMYARYQVKGILHFAVSHSYDHGVTWSEVKDSQIYTSNTQPIIIGYDGVPVILWGGNNSHGSDRYSRLPLNIAYSSDDAETFKGILDISHQTALMNRVYDKKSIAVNQGNLYAITNPDIVIYNRGGVDCAYIHATNFRFHIENFSDYLYKTKGAFDSFESQSYTAEGWVAVEDYDTVGAAKPALAKKGATDGEYALQIVSNNKLSRSLPYAEKGMVSFDLYVEKMGGMTFELQTAYNCDAEVTAPITLYVNENGEISYVASNGTRCATGLSLAKGSNRISIFFDGKQGAATLSVNGQSREIVFRNEFGNYICFAYIYTQSETQVFMDSFVLLDQD